MDLPGVSIADEGETGMFSLRTIRGHQVSWHRLGRWEDLFEHLEGGWGLDPFFLVCYMIMVYGFRLHTKVCIRLSEGRLGKK